MLIGSEKIDVASAALRDQARAAGRQAMDALVGLALGADSASVQLAAIKEVLDRGFGRVGQAGEGGGVVAYLLIDDGYAH
jgi:hypothetical protein